MLAASYDLSTFVNPRATPVSTIALNFDTAVTLGFTDMQGGSRNDGRLDLDDFELTRNGVLIDLTPQTGSGAVLSQGPAPVLPGQPFGVTLGFLSNFTSETGTYILTLSDISIGGGVTTPLSMTWVMTYVTPGEVTVTTSLQPSDSNSPRSMPVDTVKFTFSEIVTGVDVQQTGSGITQFELRKDGVVVPFPAAATVTGGGKEYYLNGLSSVTNGNGSYQVLLNADPNIKSLAGGQLIAPVTQAWQFRSIAVATVTPPAAKTYKAADILTLTAHFTDAVVVAGGTPTIGFMLGSTSRNFVYTGGSGTTDLVFQYTVQGSDIDTDGIALTNTIALPTGTTLKDAYGRAATLLFSGIDTSGVKIDGEAPTASPIAPVPQVYKTGDKITFVVPFSESVVVTGNPALEFLLGVPTGSSRQATLTAASLAAASAAPGAQTLTFEYTVAASDASATGITISALKLNGGTIQDAAGNNAALTFTPVQASGVVINRTGITALSVPAKTYKLGDVITFTATFSNPVTLDATGGVPRIQFLIASSGGTPKSAPYVLGNGTSSLKFRYTVVAGDLDTSGIELVNAFVDLNGGTIKDASNTNAAVSFAIPDTSGVLVDGVVPTIAGVTTPAVSTYQTGSKLAFGVTFSEEVFVTGAPKLLVTIGGISRQVDLAATSGSGTTTLNFEYTVAADDSTVAGVTVTGIALSGGTIKDAAGNNATLTPFTAVSSPPFAINRTGVTAVSVPAKTYKIGDVITFTATFSNTVTVDTTGGVPRIQFLLASSGATPKNAAFISGNGTTTLKFRYTVAAGDLDTTGIELVNAFIDLAGGAIKDASNTNAAVGFTIPDTSGVLVDGVAPTVAGVVLPAVTTYQTGNKLAFAVTFSEEVFVVGAPKLLITLGSNARQVDLAATSGTGTTTLNFEYTIAADDSTVAGVTVTGIALSGGTIKDAAGNNAALLPFTSVSSLPFAVNRTGITGVTVPAKTYKIGDAITFTVTYTNPVTVDVTGGVPRIQFLLASAGGTPKSATWISGNGTTALKFRYTVVAGDLDTTGIDLVNAFIDLAGGTIKDASNTNAAVAFPPPDTSGVLVDGVAPTVAGVVPPVATTYQTGSKLAFAVNFSEPVLVTGAPKLLVTIGSATRQVDLAPTSGSGTTTLHFEYWVAADDSTNSGVTVTGITLAGGAIRDAAGNDATLTPFTPVSSLSFAINRTGITTLTVPAKSYKLGDAIIFTATFNNPVVVTGSPDIPFLVGTTQKSATYFSGTGTNALTFRYLVASGDLDTNGIDLVGSAINLNGGAVATAGNVAASVVFAPPDTSGVLVDGVPPTPTATSVPLAGNYKAGDILTVSVTFSEAVRVTPSFGLGNLPSIPLVIGTRTVQAAYAAGSDTPELAFQYVVASNDLDLDGIAVGSAIALNGAVIADPAGNNSSLAISPPSTTGVLVDAVLPVISKFAVPSTFLNGRYSVGTSIPIVATVSKAVVAGGSIVVTLDTGADVVLTAASAGTSLTGTYVVAAGQNSPDLTVASIAGSTIADSFGNLLGNYSVPTGVNNIAGTRDIVVDTLAPTVTSLTSLVANGTYGAQQTVTFAVNFTERVFVAGGTPQVFLNTSPSRAASYVSGSGTTSLVFSYVVQAADVSARLDQASTSALTLNGATLRDAAGNNADPTLPDVASPNSLGGASNIVVDATFRATSPGFGSSPATAKVVTTSVTTVYLTFSVPVTGVSVQSFRLYYENRSVSLAGATVKGSGTSWKLVLPKTATSLRGNYRLDIGGAGSGITSGGVPMTNVSSIYWRRV